VLAARAKQIAITNDKAQMPNQTQNPKQWQRGIGSVFKHLDFDFWVYLELRGAKQRSNSYEQG
jgi:hypothetical protein